MAGLPVRIAKESERLIKDPVPGISAAPFEDNLRYFNVVIEGPKETPYEGGLFKLEMYLPDEYPMVSPTLQKIRFLTKIYHPNIDKLGRICLDILKDKCVFKSAHGEHYVVQLHVGACADDPLANDIAEVWKTDQKRALALAREWTAKYASA